MFPLRGLPDDMAHHELGGCPGQFTPRAREAQRLRAAQRQSASITRREFEELISAVRSRLRPTPQPAIPTPEEAAAKAQTAAEARQTYDNLEATIRRELEVEIRRELERHYENCSFLGLDPTIRPHSAAAVHEAFRAQSLLHHPDMETSSDVAFQKLVTARDFLLAELSDDAPPNHPPSY